MIGLGSSILLVPVILALLLVVRRISLSLIPTPIHGGIPRPPYLPNWVPFLGSAIGMASGDSFWTAVSSKYGPIVRVTAMGDTRTFVTSAPLIAYVYKHSKNFQFPWFRKNIQSIVFGLSLDKSFSHVWEDKIYPAHHRSLQPNAIENLIAAYADELEVELPRRLDAVAGKEVDLVEFAYETIYVASTRAMFGKTFPAAALLKDFIDFDKKFPFLLLSHLPKIMTSSAENARKKVLDDLETWWASIDQKEREFVMPSVLSMTNVGEEEGWGSRDIATLLLAEWWALGANAPLAAIWAMLEINRRPALVKSLRQEVSNAIHTLSPPSLSTLLRLPAADLIQLLPNLNAVLQETLRFYSDSASLRVVGEDCVVPADLCVGGPGAETGIALLGGEQVVCVTRAPAVDPEGAWGPDASSWDYRRFVDSDKRGPMNPFGGGVSMCEGRHFASAEILTLIASFLMLTEFEVLEDTITVEVQRVGLGIQQPKGKCRARVARRKEKS